MVFFLDMAYGERHAVARIASLPVLASMLVRRALMIGIDIRALLRDMRLAGGVT